MELYFQNSNNERIKISEPITYQDVWDSINVFLNMKNYKSYYSRIWKEDDCYWFDVGSHTEFFVLTGDFREFEEFST